MFHQPEVAALEQEFFMKRYASFSDRRSDSLYSPYWTRKRKGKTKQKSKKKNRSRTRLHSVSTRLKQYFSDFSTIIWRGPEQSEYHHLYTSYQLKYLGYCSAVKYFPNRYIPHAYFKINTNVKKNKEEGKEKEKA